MTAFLGNLIFLNPWLLAALAILPALWVLLKIMPPSPKRIFLPSSAFLEGLIPTEKTPSHTPWWILLLRLLIAALMILAFAQPVLNPSNTLSNGSKIRIVIENGWGAAHLWDTQMDTARNLLSQAARDNREVTLVTTAPTTNTHPEILGPFSASEAQEILGGLAPQPWQSNYVQLELSQHNDTQTYWLSDGLDSNTLQRVLEDLGDVQFYAPPDEDLPIALNYASKFTLNAPEALPENLPLTLQALDENGRVLGLQNITEKSFDLDLPEILRGKVAQVKIAERQSAGSMVLLGEQFGRKAVGLVAPQNAAKMKPFIEASYYLTRALEPYADLSIGTMDEILSKNLSMIILPDIAVIGTDHLNRLENWVREGGLLLRFAGPNMAEARNGQNFLLPVPVRSGTRASDGTLSWDDAPKLSSFPEHSPFFGIALREDVTVRQQALAQPVSDLADKTWARLDDGTPLVTASSMEEGLLVMVHTTASPDWSDLPLSGAFVQMLSRMVKLAGAAPDNLQTISGSLQPILVLDGYGRMVEPDSSIRAIPAQDFENVEIGPQNPPGIYGRGGVNEVLNLGPQIKTLRAITDLPSNVSRQTYGTQYETNMMPYLLGVAVALLLVDWLVMLLLSTHLNFKRIGIAVVLIAFMPGLAFANSNYADGLYLAYFKSTDASVNQLSEAGLNNLAKGLQRRTSAEPQGVVALSADTDELSFFPLIYWPVSPRDGALSPVAVANVQSYLDRGGTILIDTRSPDGDTRFLRDIMGGLSIPSLAPIAADHVLGKSFYLLDQFPGRYQGSTLWVESNSAAGRDGVSSVIIGAHDWAGAWSDYAARSYRSGPTGRQRELAMRFGVNVMMYALTGNYKADQVHVEHILERLGQ